MNRPIPRATCGYCGGVIGDPDHDKYCMSYRSSQHFVRDTLFVFLFAVLITFIFICFC